MSHHAFVWGGKGGRGVKLFRSLIHVTHVTICDRFVHERFSSLKCNYVQKRESSFSLGLDTQKYASHQKKRSNKSFLPFNFEQENLRGHMSTSPHSGARGLERFPSLKYNLYI